MSIGSESDAALDWLLSIAATCTSSPIPTTSSSPPDFTDWLHISPSSESPSTPDPSSPFQDVSSSSRVNIPSQCDDLGLHSRYISALLGLYDVRIDNTSNNIAADSAAQVLVDAQAPGIFSQHHRMLSLESNNTTLINTPSPHTLALFSPTNTAVHHSSQDALSPCSLLFSPASQLIQELQNSPFGQFYYDPAAPALTTQAISDVSPVVRADKMHEYLEPAVKPTQKPKKKKRRIRHPQLATSFMERLRAAPISGKSAAPSRQTQKLHTQALDPATNLAPAVLLSPCKLAPARSPRPQLEELLAVDTDTTTRTPQDAPLPILSLAIESPAHSLFNSPLTPLTPLTSSPSLAPTPLKITLKIKRPAADPNPWTPVRRSKRPRRATIIESSPLIESELTPSERSPSPESAMADTGPVFTNRTLPGSIEISPHFPLFYRRFPASAYYQPPGAVSPYTLCDVAPPGGVYNPPRSMLDLYTPRFVKGKGVEKVGLCPICIERQTRGGENKKLWLAMKFSAFKCYHMQYAHGISASTGQPFSPPTAFRTVQRPNPGKKERHQIQQGKCHKCDKWVAVEGIKDMENKVKELHWWKHAAACHHESSVKGEGGYYEEDNIFAKLMELADQASP